MLVKYGNLGIVKDGLVLYYNIKDPSCYRGEATTNLLSDTNLNNWTKNNAASTYKHKEMFDRTFAYRVEDSTTSLYSSLSVSTPSLTLGSQYTLSIWFKLQPEEDVRAQYRITFSSPTELVGIQIDTKTGNISNPSGLDNLVVDSFGISETKSINGEIWKKAYISFVMSATRAGTISLFPAAYSTSNVASELIVGSNYFWGPQLELKSYPTNTLSNGGTRSNLITGGGGFLDLSGVSNVHVNTDNIEYDINGPKVTTLNKYIWFGGSNPQLANITNDGNSHTFEMWFQRLGNHPGTNAGYIFGRRGSHSGFGQSNNLMGYATLWYNDSTAAQVGVATSTTINIWYHFVWVIDETNNESKIYMNGVQIGSTVTITKPLRNYGAVDYYMYSGSGTDYSGNGRIGIARIYSKALSQSEVLQNFNAQKYLFGY